MSESSTRWIIGSSATALWTITVLAAAVELALHWYLAIWLATALASSAILVCAADALARKREARKEAARRAASEESTRILSLIVGGHAERMEKLVHQHADRLESATAQHGQRLAEDVLGNDHWAATAWRGKTLGQIDAAIEAAHRAGNDTGPLPRMSAGPR